MNKGKLFVCIGSARCGKSTFCDKWVRESGDNPKTIVCADNIRKAISGDRWNSFAEPYAQAIKHTMIRAYLDRGFDVICDGTNTTEYSLIKLAQIDPGFQYKIFNVPMETCIQRAKDTKQSDLIPVIYRHYENMGWIFGENGFQYPDVEAIKTRIKNLKKVKPYADSRS